jgi:predicted DNA-binding transcriptional regulator AlpA
MDNADLDRVTPFPKWRKRVGISKATGDRMRRKGLLPKLTQLSDRLTGVRERHHLEWLDSRAEHTADDAA